MWKIADKFFTTLLVILLKPKNVIDSGYHHKEISKAIKKALSKGFKKSISKLKNPYTSKINTTDLAKMILKIKKNEKIIKKKFHDIRKIWVRKKF